MIATYAAEYQENLDELVGQLRSDLGISDLPFIVARISSQLASSGFDFVGLEDVRIAQ